MSRAVQRGREEEPPSLRESQRAAPVPGGGVGAPGRSPEDLKMHRLALGAGGGALFLLAPSPPMASTVSHPSGLHTPGHPGPPRSHVGGGDQLWSNEET